MPAERGLSVPGGRPAASGEADRARREVRGLLDEVARLDAEVEALSRRLAEFARAWEREAGPALAELEAAERLVRRLQQVEDEVARLAAALRRGPERGRGAAAVGRGRTAARRGAGEPAEGPDAEAEEPADGDGAQATGPGDAAPELLTEEVALKRLWRRLARLLHPDLAAGDADRERLSGLMARVNAAYDAGDLAALELMAERVGAGEDPEAPGEAERLAHLARRAAALSAVRESLRAEEERLRATDTARLLGRAEERRRAGGDLLAEAREAARAESAAAREDALHRIDRLHASARDLARHRRNAMDRLARRGPTGALRPFDPVAESPLVRRGAALLAARGASAAARELARRLEEQAAGPRPWEAALTLLAFFAEAAGTPPASLAAAGPMADAWAAATAGTGAPDLAGALGRLPRHLALGLRVQGRELPFGLHLAEPELAAGVRVALAREPVREAARRVLGALGPPLRCRACRAGRPALHLLRIRGLDELHGLVCPTCGAVLRSYWQYGEAGGLEALAPLALEVGLVAEVALRLGGATVALQLLPAERERLTAGGLRDRLLALLFAPYRIELPPRALRIRAGRRELPARERLPEGRLAAAIEGGPLGEVEALELLRTRVERRFRD